MGSASPPITQPSVSAPAALAYAPVAPPRTAPVSGLAPAAVPVASVGEDSIGILNLGKAVFAQLTVGSLPVTMQIDTGATDMTVSEKVAQTLLANGEAETTDDGRAILADGSRITEKRVIIHDVTIGMHGLRNVVAGVVSNDAEMLLPFPVLTAIGIVTIDTTANKLIFNRPSKTVDVQTMPVAVPPTTPVAATPRKAQAALELPPGFSTTPPKSDLFDATAHPDAGSSE